LTTGRNRFLLLAMEKSGFLLCAGVLFATFHAAAFSQQPAAQGTAGADQQASYKLVEKEIFVRIPPNDIRKPQFVRPMGLNVLEVYYSLADAAPEKHPLVLLTHGSSEDRLERARLTPWSLAEQAKWFARRGYVAFVVVRSGYGLSPGDPDLNLGPCMNPSGGFQDIANAGADDLRLVLNFARKQPEVDANSIVSIGESSGGFAQLALIADPPPGLRAAISFAGALGHDGNEHSCNLPLVVDAFRAFGKGARKHGDLPMLWVFAQNDHWFPPYMTEKFQEAYTKAGGKSQLVMAPPDGSDGHHLFSHVPAWSGTVEAFLRAQNLLPLGDRVLPEPLPPEIPMPAGLKNSDAETWNRFLLAAPYKTLVVDDHGGTWLTSAESNQPAADFDAKEQCRKGQKNNHCTIVAQTPSLK
jgi:dienelactone hydrolase